jgi:hypothetical protein
MMTGTEIGKALFALKGLEREKRILEIFASQGLAPTGGDDFRRIVSTATIDKKLRRLEMECLQIPVALGTKEDFLMMPAWPWTYQTIANARDCVIPSKLMVTLVAQQADFRIPPIAISPNTIETKLYIESNAVLLHELKKPDVKGVSYVPGMLVVSPKKDVVTGPGLDGKHVAIVGWFYQPGPQTDTPKGRIQAYNPKDHDSQYVDYSHGCRLFRRVGYLDGIPVSLSDIAKDPKLCVLVSDQGPFPLRFPSLETGGPGVVTKVATGASVVAGAAGGAAVGFVVGGPAGAAVGALLGAAFGRSV